MHHFFFLSLYLAWLGGWTNPVQPHLHSPCLTQLDSREQLGSTRRSCPFRQVYPNNGLARREREMGWSCSSARLACSRELRCSFITSIEDLLFPDQTAICNFEYWLVEWLVLVVTISVGCSHLIGVLVPLSPPAVAIPQLPVAFIT